MEKRNEDPAPKSELTPERIARVAAAVDDPCDEGGYDQFCRDERGQLCQFHEQHCKPPDYPCLDLLRHKLAIVFLEEIEARRAGELARGAAKV